MNTENHTVLSTCYYEGEVLIKMSKADLDGTTQLHQTMTSSEAIVFATQILDACRQIQDSK